MQCNSSAVYTSTFACFQVIPSEVVTDIVLAIDPPTCHFGRVFGKFGRDLAGRQYNTFTMSISFWRFSGVSDDNTHSWNSSYGMTLLYCEGLYIRWLNSHCTQVEKGECHLDKTF